MILAEVHTAPNNLFFVRFSEPNEKFKANTWIPIMGIAEVEKRIYFRNRMHIITALTGYLNQRAHAKASYVQECRLLTNLLAEFKNASLYKLCEFVNRKRDAFESIAPKYGSKFCNHYNTIIVPILDFASSEDNQR